MKSCEKASALASAALDRRLTPGEFIGLWVHRALCGPCRIYRRQLLILRRSARQIEPAPSPTVELGSSAKDRIRERLRAAAADQSRD